MRSLLHDPPRVVRGPGSEMQPLRRFALIGDIHAEDERLEAAIACVRAQRVEALLAVGDVADGEGDLHRTIEILTRERVHVVAGNHDRWFLASEQRTSPKRQLREAFPAAVEAIRFWPPMLELSTTRGALLLAHGIGDDDEVMVRNATPDDEVRALPSWARIVKAARYRFVAGGHTHEAMARTIDGITLLNPGTLRRDHAPEVAVVDIEAGTMRLFGLADPRGIAGERTLRFEAP